MNCRVAEPGGRAFRNDGGGGRTGGSTCAGGACVAGVPARRQSMFFLMMRQPISRMAAPITDMTMPPMVNAPSVPIPS